MIQRVFVIAALAFVASFGIADEVQAGEETNPLDWMVGEWQVEEARLEDGQFELLEISPILVKRTDSEIIISYSYWVAHEMLPIRSLAARIGNKTTITWKGTADTLGAMVSEEYKEQKYRYDRWAKPANENITVKRFGLDQWEGPSQELPHMLRRLFKDKFEIRLPAFEKAPLTIRCKQSEQGKAIPVQFDVRP